MTYQMKPLSCDPARIKGMSERLIISHYENNYGGAVKRLNLIEEKLGELDFASSPGFLVNGLKREQLIAMNSMALHEVFFDGLGDQSEPSGPLRDAIVRDFGSFERWRANPTIGAPSGESPFDVADRALAAVDDLRARYDSGNVLIVSHKTVLRVLFCRLLNIDLRLYRDTIEWPTGAVTVLDIGPRGAVARLMVDERHLFPQARRNLVGEQTTRWGETDVPTIDIDIDDDPSGSDGAGDLGVAADDDRVGVVTGMAPAMDPGLAQHHEGGDLVDERVQPLGAEGGAVEAFMLA